MADTSATARRRDLRRPGRDSEPSPGSVFLITDFGTHDEFAGVLHAVLLREAPDCTIVDLTHQIPHFDVRAGALALARAVPHLGPGVVVGVVDPGVGTERRALVVTAGAGTGTGPRFFVGPDNGLFGFALDVLGGATAAVELPHAPPSPAVGATFDGRDLFAPAAARLWSGARPEDLGSAVEVATLVQLDPPRLHVEPGRIDAEVLWVDGFGNVQLAADGADLLRAGLGALNLVVAGRSTVVARRTAAFTETSERTAAPDEVGMLLDSNGHLALVCNRRSAATVLGVRAGDLVTVRRHEGAVAGGAAAGGAGS